VHFATAATKNISADDENNCVISQAFYRFV
jgi:hypothetical protein